MVNKKESLICPQCLKQLKKCYEFVQQLKNSQFKLQKGKEITTEHDYFEIQRTEQIGNESTSIEEKVTENTEDSLLTIPKAKFKPILPKSPNSESDVKETNLHLTGKSRLYKCLKCEELLKSFKALKVHEEMYCKNTSYEEFQACKYCHKCYSKEGLLTEHISKKHSQEEYLCCLCNGKSFAGKGYLARHIEKVHQHKRLQYYCGQCQKLENFVNLEEVQRHFIQHHPVLVQKTTLPDESSHNALNDEDMDLEMHEEFLDEFLLAHTNENSFQFSECWEALDLHLPDMLQGTSPNLGTVRPEFTEAFPCPKCFEQFKHPQPLLKHLAEIHNMPVLVCRSCNHSFASLSKFKKHKLDRCRKQFNTNSLKLECPYCSKTFANNLNLKQHLRIVHSQFNRHICQLCDKQFATLDHLKKHVLSQHQNERKHNCSICNKLFTQLCHLKQHMKIHTTGKTIECLQCSLKFWRKIDLERHEQKKHRGVS